VSRVIAGGNNAADEDPAGTRREGVNPPAVPSTSSIFPDDTVAIIYKPARSGMNSGKARTREWKLRLEPRSPPVVEPLMGWTAGEDTLTQVDLTFATVEAAIAYAWRRGLHFMVQGAGDAPAEVRGVADSASSNGAPLRENPGKYDWRGRRRRVDRTSFPIAPDGDMILPKNMRARATC
jgi:ETC complex I subunit conserved region